MRLFGFLTVRAFDIVDIVLVALLLYEFFRFVKGTKATPILVGLAFFFIVSFIARWLDLMAFSWIMRSILAVWVVAFVIVFQPEIRNVLARIGKQRSIKFFLKVEESPVIDEIVDAIRKMSEDKVGALIETGVKVNAQVNSSLLRTIFFPDTPLHDGACVIQGDTLVAASCVLPLSENPSLSGQYGLRHRAALGISEQSDAICLVVSEETGKISFAYKGKLVTKVEIAILKRSLETILLKA